MADAMAEKNIPETAPPATEAPAPTVEMCCAGAACSWALC